MAGLFEVTLPVGVGQVRIRGPQHSGDKECTIVATTEHLDYIMGAHLEADEVDALISILQGLRHVMNVR